MPRYRCGNERPSPLCILVQFFEPEILNTQARCGYVCLDVYLFPFIINTLKRFIVRLSYFCSTFFSTSQICIYFNNFFLEPQQIREEHGSVSNININVNLQNDTRGNDSRNYHDFYSPNQYYVANSNSNVRPYRNYYPSGSQNYPHTPYRYPPVPNNLSQGRNNYRSTNDNGQDPKSHFDKSPARRGRGYRRGLNRNIQARRTEVTSVSQSRSAIKSSNKSDNSYKKPEKTSNESDYSSSESDNSSSESDYTSSESDNWIHPNEYSSSSWIMLWVLSHLMKLQFLILWNFN